jgi:hypothetical protein
MILPSPATARESRTRRDKLDGCEAVERDRTAVADVGGKAEKKREVEGKGECSTSNTFGAEDRGRDDGGGQRPEKGRKRKRGSGSKTKGAEEIRELGQVSVGWEDLSDGDFLGGDLRTATVGASSVC